MRVRFLLSAVLLACLVSVTLTSCGPQTATLEVMVEDIAGAPLSGIQVAVEEETATTGEDGVATLSDLMPGTATVRLSGEGYEPIEWVMELEPDDNAVTQQLRAEPLAVLPPDGLDALQIRVESVVGEISHLTEATLVNEQGSHWDWGHAELIVLLDGAYLREDDDVTLGFKYYDATLAEITPPVSGYLEMAQSQFDQIAFFHEWVATDDALIRPAGSDVANGYECRIYTVRLVDAPDAFGYTVWVVADGPHAGRITRYEQVIPESDSTLIVDLYDFDEPLMLTRPV